MVAAKRVKYESDVFAQSSFLKLTDNIHFKAFRIVS